MSLKPKAGQKYIITKLTTWMGIHRQVGDVIIITEVPSPFTIRYNYVNNPFEETSYTRALKSLMECEPVLLTDLTRELI
jgi:hypothetical protein